MNPADYIQLGLAAAVAIVLVRYMVLSNTRSQRFTQELIENHLQHNTAALDELRGAVRELTSAIHSGKFDSKA